MMKHIKTKNKLDPQYRYFIDGIPEDNVIDLRKAVIAKKPLSPPLKESVVSVPKEKIIKKKKPSFWSVYLESRKAKKEAKQLEKEKKIAAQLQYKEEIKEEKKNRSYSFKLAVKPGLGFALFCLILTLPITALAFYRQLYNIKDSVMSLSGKALSDIKVGSALASEFNFQDASSQFNNAFSEFNKADEEINSFNQSASKIIELIPGKGEEYKSAKNLLAAGTKLSAAAEELALGLDVVNKVDWQVLQNIDAEDPPALTDIIVLGHSHFKPASLKIDEAIADLEKVDPSKLPSEYQSQIASFKEHLPLVNSSLKQVINLSEMMLTILGHDQQKRYLVVFQNNREIRASGGFLGSFGLIDIYKVSVTNIAIPGGGTYDLNGQLQAKIISPEPLHLVNPIWQIQDANWWPDWPTSAQKIEWFYNQSNGPTVDGVLSLTPDVIEEMLSVTGPIDMTDPYGVIINSDNFYQIVQTEAEKKYDETQTSKQIIADLTPKLLDKLFTLKSDNALSVLQIFYNALREKQILLYFNDPLLEEEIQKLGWSGDIKDSAGDYLGVIDTNIGGGKTNALIEEVIEHEANVQPDASIEDSVKITYTHKGKEGEPLFGMINWNYLRIYVPEGSELIDASGFTQPDKESIQETPDGYEIDKDLKNISGTILLEDNYKMRINKEFGKTVFSNWVKINPGQSTTINIKYRLPKKLDTNRVLNNIDTYSLLVQKQAGSFNSLFYTKLNLPSNYVIKWQYPKDFKGTWSTLLDTDKYIGAVVAKETQ